MSVNFKELAAKAQLRVDEEERASMEFQKMLDDIKESMLPLIAEYSTLYFIPLRQAREWIGDFKDQKDLADYDSYRDMYINNELTKIVGGRRTFRIAQQESDDTAHYFIKGDPADVHFNVEGFQLYCLTVKNTLKAYAVKHYFIQIQKEYTKVLRGTVENFKKEKKAHLKEVKDFQNRLKVKHDGKIEQYFKSVAHQAVREEVKHRKQLQSANEDLMHENRELLEEIRTRIPASTAPFKAASLAMMRENTRALNVYTVTRESFSKHQGMNDFKEIKSRRVTIKDIDLTKIQGAHEVMYNPDVVPQEIKKPKKYSNYNLFESCTNGVYRAVVKTDDGKEDRLSLKALTYLEGVHCDAKVVLIEHFNPKNSRNVYIQHQLSLPSHEREITYLGTLFAKNIKHYDSIIDNLVCSFTAQRKLIVDGKTKRTNLTYYLVDESLFDIPYSLICMDYMRAKHTHSAVAKKKTFNGNDERVEEHLKTLLNQMIQ